MFENFRERMSTLGGSIRETQKRQSINIMEAGFEHSQSYRKVSIDGKNYDARIISDSKTTVRGGNGNFVIQFRNDFSPTPGTYVDIPDKNNNSEKWIILYESDSIMFPKHIIKKCNYLLKWKNSKGKLIERWAVFDDNTRIREGVSFIQGNKGQTPFNTKSLVLPFDEETVNIRVDKRFLIDSILTEGNPDAWIVTNRNVISKVFNSTEGVIELSISQHQFNKDVDNKELMIADYYKKYEPTSDEINPLNYDCKISYNSSSDLKMGTPFKKYFAKFYKNGVLDESVSCEWELTLPDDSSGFTYEIDSNVLKIKCIFDSKLMGTHIRLKAFNEEIGCSCEIPVKVVSSI